MSAVAAAEESYLEELPTGVLVIGGSAGSLGPLVALIGGLPNDFPAAVAVTIHIGEGAHSQLAPILSRAGSLAATQAVHNEPLRRGVIYVAPPGRHLLIAGGCARLNAGPRVNRHRPAVDVLFGSAAATAAARCLAVVLSGVLDDGAVGAALVDQAGGRVLVQDPADAEFRGMPAAALAAVPSALVIPATSMSRKVIDLMDEFEKAAATPARSVMPSDPSTVDAEDLGFLARGEARPTRLACPECGGGLARIDLPNISYFRCHVGHQYSPNTLIEAQAHASEAKLWSAVAALEEQAAMHRFLTSIPNGQAPEPAGGHVMRAQVIAERAKALKRQIEQWELQPGSTE